MLTERVQAEIMRDSEKEIESCGLVLFKKDFFTHPCRNSAENPRDFFSINTKDYIQGAARGEIVAYYHSHIQDNDFGDIDKSNSQLEETPYIIYIKPRGEFKTFFPNEYVNPYIGRSYEIGKSDCYSLFKGYYEKEFGVRLPEFQRDSKWEEETPRLFEDNFPKHGFKEVNDLRKGDGILFKYKEQSPACHIGTYLGDGTFLHHPPGRFSLIEQYNNAYKRRTKFVIRWHSL